MVDAPLQHGFSPSSSRRSSRQSSSSIQRLSFSQSHRRISAMSAGEGDGLSRQGSTLSRGGNMRGFGVRTSIASELGALMEIDGNQSQNDLEHELREQLRGPLEDVSRQRLRAVRMALRRHGNVDSRISQKDFLTVFQENGIKISSRLLSLLLHRFENQFGVDYENMWKLMYDTQHTTGRDSVMAKNASNENSTADKLDQSFHNSADLKLVERIKTQFAKSGDEFDLEEFRDELKVRDRGHTTTLSKKEMKKAVAEMQVPIYGNVMNALMKRCDDECNGQISWPEFLRFLTAARDSLARGDDGTDLNASGSKLWNIGTSSTRTSTGEEQKKMSTVSSGPRLIEGTPYSESPRPSTPQSLGLKRNSMPSPKASSVSPRKARSMASETLRGYDGSSSGTEDSRKRRGSPIAEETHRAKSPDSLSALTEPKPPPAQQAITPAPAPEEVPKISPPPDQSTAQRKDEKPVSKNDPAKDKKQTAPPSTAPTPPLTEKPPTPPTPSPAPIPPQEPPPPITSPIIHNQPTPEPNGIFPGKPSLLENSTETKTSKENGKKPSQRKTSPPSRENTIDKDPPAQKRPTKSAVSRKSVHIVEKRESSASVVKKLPPKSAPPKRSTTEANLRRVSSQMTKTQPSKSTVDLRKNSPPLNESPPLPGEVLPSPTQTPSQTPTSIPHIPSANSLTSESIISHSGSDLEASMTSNNSLASLASKKGEASSPDVSDNERASSALGMSMSGRGSPTTPPSGRLARMGKAVAMAEKARSGYGKRQTFSPERPNTSVGTSRHIGAAGRAVVFAEGTKLRDGKISPKSPSPQGGRKISMATARKAAMFGQRPSSRNGMSESETEASDQALPSINTGRRVMAFVGSAKQRRQDRSPSPGERSQSPKTKGIQSAGRAMMLAGKGRPGSAQEKEAVTESAPGQRSPSPKSKGIQSARRAMMLAGKGRPGSAQEKEAVTESAPGQRSPSPKSKGLQSARRAMMLAGKGRPGSAQEKEAVSEISSAEEELTNKQKIKLAQKAMAFSPKSGKTEQKEAKTTPRPRSPWLNKVQGSKTEGKVAAAFSKRPGKAEKEVEDSAEMSQDTDKENSGKKSPVGSIKKMSLMGKMKMVQKENNEPEIKQTDEKKWALKQGLLSSAKQKSFMDKIKSAANEMEKESESPEVKQSDEKKQALKQGLLSSAKQKSFMDKLKSAAKEMENESESPEKDEKEDVAAEKEEENKGKTGLASSMKKMSLMGRLKTGEKEQQVAKPSDKKEADSDKENKGKITLSSSTKKMSFMAKMKGGGAKEQPQESEPDDKEEKNTPEEGGEEKKNLTTAAKKLSLMKKLKGGEKESEDSEEPVATAENSNQNDSPEVKQEEEAKNLTRRESTVTITSVNMSNKDEEAAPKKKGMFGSMKKFFGSKSKPKKEEIPIETIKEPEKPKEPEVPPPDGKPVTVNIRGTDLDVYIPDRYWYKPVNHKYPEHKLSLDWVFGYRGNDCRNNLFPLASGEVVYFTGTVAVMYDHLQCRQRHYVEHTGEIRSIAVHPDKVTVATGQTEVQYDSYSQAHIRIWDSRTLQTQKVLGTGALENAVIALTFSGTLDRLAAIDSSEGHMMSVWDIKSGRKLTEARVDTEVVCQVGFSPRSPDTIVTAGKEHLVWWELGVETGTLQEVARANYDQRYNKAKYIICFVHNERGDLITGDSNGTVFVWGEGGNNITQALKHIHEGPVFSLLMMKNFLLTAGRDGMVFAFPWGKNMEHTGFSASLQVPRVEGGIRMQCVTADGAVLLLGTTVNSILSAGLTSASCPLLGASLDKDVVTQGHFDDVKAICPQPSHAAPGQFVTAGNDGTVCMHDSDSHILQWKFVIKGATIQCADYYHPGSLPRVALGTKDGSVIVLEANDLDEVSEMCRASKIARGRITVIKICPDGDRIAIGCQDGSVQILQLTDYCSKLELLGKCKGHKGAITGLDWSADLPTGGYIIQTSSSQYQHFLWDVDQCVQLTDMAGLRNTEWLTYNCMLGYVVKDIWNAGLDGRDVRTLDRAPNWRHVGTADERGEIHIFTYPCAHKDAQADTYKCHSSQVSCLRFLHDNVHLVTAGGKDTSILLWKIISQ
ncbi:uncharacterized protein LOC144861944 isoform X2 [Branchiostoma floridae x Branchiostoma japonicum]